MIVLSDFTLLAFGCTSRLTEFLLTSISISSSFSVCWTSTRIFKLQTTFNSTQGLIQYVYSIPTRVVKVIYLAEIILWFHLLKCVDLLLVFSVFYHCKLNIFGFQSVDWTKQKQNKIINLQIKIYRWIDWWYKTIIGCYPDPSSLMLLWVSILMTGSMKLIRAIVKQTNKCFSHTPPLNYMILNLTLNYFHLHSWSQ